MKKLTRFLMCGASVWLAFAAFAAQAQFAPGQVLTAAQLNLAFANVLPLAGGTLTGPLTVPTLNTANAHITGGTISGLSVPLAVSSGGTGTTTATGTGSAVLATSPTVTGTAANPFTVTGIHAINDTGRANNDNTPTVDLTVSEALNYTASYATHYAFIVNATQLTGGTGDRIGVGAIQTCNATLSGKSCVGLSGLAVPAGATQGNFTGINARALVPAGLTGPIGAAVAFEADVETHSPVLIRNGVRVGGENMSGGTSTHGSVEDAGIALVTDSGVNNDGFQIGLLFGETAQGYPNNWPILPGGTYWQAYSPTVQAAYGIDWTGSTAGWSKYAIALPQNTTGADIAWGTAGTAGVIGSTATTTGGAILFTNSGIAFNNPSGGALLNVGGSSGADVINNGYITEASLTGFVYCNGSGGRCTASTNNGLAATSASIGGASLAAGACASGTATVTGATTSMVAQASPTTYPGDGNVWHAYVSAANTVTVKVCAIVTGTPTASTYNVRVLQ